MYRLNIITLLTALFIVMACQKKNTEMTGTRGVKTVIAKSYQESEESLFSGKVKASNEVNMAFKIPGSILTIPVNEGQFVKKDEVIATLDPRDYETQLKATTAEYNAIKGEAERIIELYKDSSVATNDYEKAKYGLEQITAKLQAHQNQLNDTKLKAPFDGYIQKIYFEKNETIGAGTPVISIIENSLPLIEINIPISEYSKRKEFESFSCNFDFIPGKNFPLTLIGISPKANLNQLYNVKLKFPEHNSTITPGMTTTVKIIRKGNNDNRIIIPLTAIYNCNGKSCVMKYDPNNGIVNEQIIEIESIQRDGSAIISEGIEQGEIVVSAGADKLKSGDHVTLLKEHSKTNIGGML